MVCRCRAAASTYGFDAKSNPPDFVFVGNNHIHSDREVAVATKWAARTVVSSNIIHSIRPSRSGRKFCFDDDSGCITPDSSTNGPGIIIGADGFPEEKWIIYNLIYDTNHCIRYEEGVSVFILGNVCANIPGGGVILEKRSKELVIAHTTCLCHRRVLHCGSNQEVLPGRWLSITTFSGMAEKT